MSFLKKVFRGVTGFGFLKKLLRLASPKLGTSSMSAVEQVYEADLQQNQAKLGDPQSVLYGLVWHYPSLSAQSWSEYINNDQVLHVRMRVTVGIATALALRIGKTPLSSFAGTQVQMCLPGERMTLFHPNVFRNEQVDGVDIVGGGLLRTTYSGKATVGGTIMVSGSPVAVPSRIDVSVDDYFFTFVPTILAGAKIGGSATITGTALDDGTYTITAVDAAHSPPQWIEVDHNFTEGTATVELTFDAYDLRDNDALQAKDVNLIFDAGFSTITAAPDLTRPSDLSKFAVGDYLSPIDAGAGGNRSQNYTVLDVSGDGLSLVVTPPPSDATGISTVVLLRRYHGPYDVCPPGDQIDRVAYDLQWPQGFGSINAKNGNIGNLTMSFDPQYREVDDGGVPLGDWTSFGTLTVTDKSRRAYRRSFAYSLPHSMRAQVRIALVTKDNSSDNILDAVQLAAVRGYVIAKPGEDPAVDVDSTTLNVSLRASGQLAAGDEKKINGQFQRWLETWSPGAGWGPEVPINSPIWAALDKARGRYTARGRQLPDSMIDLPAFAALAPALETRGDEFHGTIEAISNLRDNLHTILRLGRCQLRYDWVGGKLSVYRDAPEDPIQLFGDLNASSVSGYKIEKRGPNDPTGVQVTYQDPNANEERVVGIGNTDDKPIKIDLRNGCNSRAQAWREAVYEWAIERLRKRTVQITAELEPVLIRLGDRLLVQSRRRRWGQGAAIKSATGNVLNVHPPLVWTGTGHYVILRDPQGRPAAPIACTRGASDAQIVLASAPNVEITGDETGEDRTLLAFGQQGDEPIIAIVNGVNWRTSNRGGHQATIDVTLEDVRVHAEPGPPPPDPNVVTTNPPNLTVTGLNLSSASGRVSASWTPVPNTLLYEVEWQYSGSFSWTTAARTINASATFSVPSAGVVGVRVRSFGPGGSIGVFTSSATTVMSGTGGAGALAATVSTTSLYASTTTPVGTTTALMIAVSGGTPPYSISINQQSGDAITALTPTSSSTLFRGQFLEPSEDRIAVFKGMVTDSASATVLTGDVRVEIQNTSTGGTPGGGSIP